MHSRRHRLLALLLTAGSLPCAAQAESADSFFYITPMVQAVRPDNDRAVDDDSAVLLATGFRLQPNWNVELNLQRAHFDGDHGDDLQTDAISLNALRVFRRDARIAPYLLAGVGAQRNDRDISRTSTEGFADAGIGLLARLRKAEDTGRELSLRLDARARYDGDSNLDQMVGLGLQYAFGRKSRSATQTTTAPPAPAAPVQNIAAAPQQPATPVRTTPERDIRLPAIAFAFDSAHLSAAATAALDDAARTLRLHPDVEVEVAGHTDNIGSSTYNLALSKKRAEAVRSYLVERGITNALTVRGHGEDQPTADNSTEAGRAKNRRVVLLLISQ